MAAVKSVSACILAGGRSTRMGTDKALLPWEGKTLLTHALATAHEVCGDVKIVGARERYAEFGIDTVEDEFQHCGPLAGIHAALGVSQSELNVVLSVDTPLVNAAFLGYLLQRAEAAADALVTVPDAAGGVQATCAVYRRPFRAVAEQQLKKGRYKVTETFSLVRVEYVEESEMKAAGFDPAMFANLNTPEEFARAEESRRA
jgi:molybdopterin-guanine dinucleotide biosynthesis protein A